MSNDATNGAPLARYAAAKRVGDFIFLSGVIAVDPARRLIVRGFDDIPGEIADSLGRTGEFSSDIKQGPILAQSWYVLDAIRQIIEREGGQMSDVFKLVQLADDYRKGEFGPETLATIHDLAQIPKQGCAGRGSS